MFYDFIERVSKLESDGKKMIRLDAGDTGMPPPSVAVDAVQQYFKDNKGGYLPAGGDYAFREAIAAREGCSLDNVVVGPGSKMLLYALLSVMKKADSKVMLIAPYWPAYQYICQHLGIPMVVVETLFENNWEVEDLDLTGVDIVILCNPANPTSTIYPEDFIRKVIDKAGNDTKVIIDEAYKGMAFEPIPRYDGAIRVRSFSKEFSMEGWRLGYVIAPSEIIKKVISLNQITITCVAGFIQHAGITCLQNEEAILLQRKEQWQQCANYACSELSRMGFIFAKPQSGMYVFVSHPDIKDVHTYLEQLLDKGLVLSSGSNFGGYDNFIRICLKNPIENLEHAFKLMAKM